MAVAPAPADARAARAAAEAGGPKAAGGRAAGVGALPFGAIARVAQGVVALAGVLTALGASSWLVTAAAQRPSSLSPPTLRARHVVYPWLLGPLRGLMPHVTHIHARLSTDLTTALVVMAVAWVVAWLAAGALPVRVVGGLVALCQAVWVLGPPQPLTDAFNYVVYGRMAAHGMNPYTHVPLQAPHDAAYTLANWHHMPSPYGPLFTLLSEPLGLLSTPVAFWTWKVVVVASAVGIVALVGWMAAQLGRSPQRAMACVGLCPVTLAVGIGGFHNDAPALLCLVGAAACLLLGTRAARDGHRVGGGWSAAAGALAVAAAGIKPSLAVAVPIVVLGAHRRPAAVAGAAWAAAAVVAVVAVAFGGALPAVGLQGRLVTPLSVPNLLGLATGHGGADAAVRQAGRIALVAVTLAAAAAVAWRRSLALAGLGIVLLAAAALLSWVMPWYLAWALPFAALATPRLLAPAAVVACVWFGLGGIPQLPTVLHGAGYHPTRYATGLANHDLQVRLVR